MSTDDSTPATGERSQLRVRLELWAVIVLMAIAFAGGFLVRGMGSPSGDAEQAPVTTQQAPALSEDQFGGQLPAGHPPVEASANPAPASSATR